MGNGGAQGGLGFWRASSSPRQPPSDYIPAQKKHTLLWTLPYMYQYFAWFFRTFIMTSNAFCSYFIKKRSKMVIKQYYYCKPSGGTQICWCMIRWFVLYKFGAFWSKKKIFHLHGNHFWHIVGAILKEFFVFCCLFCFCFVCLFFFFCKWNN